MGDGDSKRIVTADIRANFATTYVDDNDNGTTYAIDGFEAQKCLINQNNFETFTNTKNNIYINEYKLSPKKLGSIPR